MNISKTASALRDGLSGAAQQVADLGRTAGEKLDEVRCGTADALADAASSVRTTGRQGSDAIDDLAEHTADKLDSTAAYVRDYDLGAMLGTFRRVVRRHPASSFVGAAAFGFLLGSVLRRTPR
jgi:ElaB/YqjD/DUF883 family membrane-anchored ribosome-binding protein